MTTSSQAAPGGDGSFPVVIPTSPATASAIAPARNRRRRQPALLECNFTVIFKRAVLLPPCLQQRILRRRRILGRQGLDGDFIFFMSECVYPAISASSTRRSTWCSREDFTPGTGSGEENLIDYIDFPIDFFVGTGGTKPAPDFGVSQNFPNPASGTAVFYVNLPKPVRL
ncbi:MAG: hypothetical protein MZV64_11665 [Ignavibacteriales bacterium]|nr:hypothetical protein [Ignavibacteriales bacterium]